jgi:hypothetical protein
LQRVRQLDEDLAFADGEPVGEPLGLGGATMRVKGRRGDRREPEDD